MNLPTHTRQIDQNLWQRLTPGELFALALAFGAAGIFLCFSPQISFAFYDFKIYLNTAHGIFDGYYYAYWYLPFFSLLSKLPLNLSYMLWCSLIIAGVFLAARVFGGKAPLALLSYQMFYSLIYGSISGVIVGALALCWWGLSNRKWYWAGLGVALASGKFQIGITGSLILLFMATISWKDWLRVLVIPALVLAASLFLYPGWPLELLNNIINDPPNAYGSVSLWRWLGAWALLLCIPRSCFLFYVLLVGPAADARRLPRELLPLYRPAPPRRVVEALQRALHPRPPDSARMDLDEPLHLDGTPSLRVLLVEDNLVNQMVAQALLERLGATVVLAGDGEQALQRLAEAAYDLVLMDCQMPVLDGPACTRRWRDIETRTQRPRIPVVAMTATSDDDAREACRAAGMDDFLTKPVEQADLAALLARVVQATAL